MVSPGLLIAAGVILIYTVLGPLVMLALNALFDSLAQGRDKQDKQDKERKAQEQDPALWTEKQIRDKVRRGEL